MKELVERKLYFNPSTGLFNTVPTNTNDPFILAKQEVEVSEEYIHFVDVSPSMGLNKKGLILADLKENEIQSIYLFPDKNLEGQIFPNGFAWSTKHFEESLNIEYSPFTDSLTFLQSLPKHQIPVIYTDGILGDDLHLSSIRGQITMKIF